jgi:hypothetical protein
MKAPRYRYFDPGKPNEKPTDPDAARFWKWERIFWQQAKRLGAERMVEVFWANRERGSYLDKLDSEPEEDRALVMWMVLQCGRWCPYEKFDARAYFSRSTRR